MDKYKLDAEEEEIMKEMERGEWVRDENLYNKFVSKRLTITVKEEDVKTLREKAEKVGIPYQTLISSILHRYATGQIDFKEPF